jgi:Tfp pilus assembly protein PilX
MRTQGLAVESQRGVVLVVSLIMLLLVTIMGIGSSVIVQGNLKIVQNIEAKATARSAARSALQEAIAYGQFIKGPSVNAFAQTCGNNLTKCFDLSGDGVADDLKVVLSNIQCLSATPVKNSELDVLGSTQDASCYQPGIYSLCADTLWQVTATAIDDLTGARVTINQGVRTRTTTNLIAVACN